MRKAIKYRRLLCKPHTKLKGLRIKILTNKIKIMTKEQAIDPMEGLKEIKANWFKWGLKGDWCRGVLTDVREMESAFADKKGEMVKIYEIMVTGGSFHYFEKVGGEKTIHVNTRVISATNKDLKKEVQQKRIRKDLFYRLNVIPIHIPPLRERRNDIPLLVDHFLKEAEQKHQNTPPKISKEAVSVMMRYHWPGNVRELQNAIQFAIVNCSGDTIFPKDLPMELKDQSLLGSSRGASRKLNVKNVKTALIKTGGNKAKAARILGVGRATLYRFLADYPDAV